MLPFKVCSRRRLFVACLLKVLALADSFSSMLRFGLGIDVDWKVFGSRNFLVSAFWPGSCGRGEFLCIGPIGLEDQSLEFVQSFGSFRCCP